MFHTNADKSIFLTRGDIASIEVSAKTRKGDVYMFQVGDVVRFGIYLKNDYQTVVLLKDVNVEVETEVVTISLTSDDTRIGEFINKPKDYWYEIELNPDTASQTLVGHDIDGPKIFRLFPEGSDEK
jgi:hypothetical protein